MSLFLLVDGNNLAFASQLANSKLTAGDIETTAIFGVTGSMRLLAEKFPGAKQIVLWDWSPTWRHTFYPEYKGKRDSNPTTAAAKTALEPQRPRILELLANMGIEQFRARGFEADDLAGFFSRELSKSGANIVFVSNDQDWLQLVTRQVSWFDPRTDGGKLIGDLLFETQTGFDTPERFLQAKCMVGDTSDNITGVGGLGDGAAKAIFDEFESIEDLIAKWPTIPAGHYKGTPLSRYVNKIRAFVASGSEGQSNLARNRKLMDLRNVHVPTNELERHKGLYDEAAVRRLFATYGFTSLLHDYDRWMAPFKRALPRAA